VASFDSLTFITDYGLEDGFVAACHGVAARIAPAARIIDITHLVQPGDVRRGAAVLAQTIPYLPPAVHVAVVDPGVGTARRGVAVQAGDSILVGPDNGLLSWAIDALGGAERAFQLTNGDLWLHPVSPTFHGRDIFSPAAAHLAEGVDPGQFGSALEPASLVRLDVPAPVIADGFIRAHVLIVDRFGNVQLNLQADDLTGAGIEPGTQVEIEIGLQRFYACAATTFADVRAGDIVLYEDAYGNVALAINVGNAAEMLAAKAGDSVGIAVRPR